MECAYIIVTAGKILDFVPVSVIQRKTDRKGEPDKQSDRADQNKEVPKTETLMCPMCKGKKPSTEFYPKNAYCKLCGRFYQRWRKYDKKREKIEGEDKTQIKKEYIEKQQSEYKQRIGDTRSVWH